MINSTMEAKTNTEPKAILLSIAREFTRFPGARYIEDGPGSGQEFRDKKLIPKFEEACRLDVNLIIDFDGAAGYATSFLEEAFGGMAREYGAEEVLRRLRFKSDDEPLLAQEVETYIRNSGGR